MTCIRLPIFSNFSRPTNTAMATGGHQTARLRTYSRRGRWFPVHCPATGGRTELGGEYTRTGDFIDENIMSGFLANRQLRPAAPRSVPDKTTSRDDDIFDRSRRPLSVVVQRSATDRRLDRIPDNSVFETVRYSGHSVYWHSERRRTSVSIPYRN